MDRWREDKIVERWPDWFDLQSGPSRSLMDYGFQHGNGWFDLVYNLCKSIEPLVTDLNERLKPTSEHFEVLEVKQKLGGLRFSVSHYTEAIGKKIAQAQADSFCMCETCGRPGCLRTNNRRLMTLCEECHQAHVRQVGTVAPASTSGSRFSAVFLLHGKGGSPTGSVLLLDTLLRQQFPAVKYFRPVLPHGRDRGECPVEQSVATLRDLRLPRNALVIGISLGGLAAAKLQENERPDLHVICISSPTYGDGVKLERRQPRRIAFYSSRDKVIAQRTSLWPHLAEAYDLSWLSHETDNHVPELVKLIAAYMRTGSVQNAGPRSGCEDGSPES